MKVFILIAKDRHIDTQATAYASLDKAAPAAVEFLDECTRGLWDERPADPILAGFEKLSEGMRRDSWRWYLNTYDDGPSAWIVESELIQ